VGSEEILDRVEETLGALARRAYEIFESKGRHPGRDLEDCGCANIDKQHKAIGQLSVDWTLAHTSRRSKDFMREPAVRPVL
jgi:hypothetical protein